MRMGYSLVQQTGEGEVIDSGQTTLDATGRVKVQSKLEADKEAKRIGPGSFTLEAQVTDQNRQLIANRRVIVVHPASRYIGLRADKTVARAGEPIKVSLVLVDLKGQRVAGQELTVEAVQVQTKISTVYEEGRWAYKFEDKEKVVGSCAVKTAKEPRECALTLPLPGGYRLRAAAPDEKQRKTRTSLQVYAYGPGYVPWNLQNQSQLELVPDKVEYRPGEVARVLVKSPLQGGLGLLTVQRGGLDRVEVLSLPGTAQVVEVPIKASHVPEVHLAISLARGRLPAASLGKATEDLGRPTFAHGTVRLPVVLDEKRVKVEVTPEKEAIGPGEKLKVKLSAKDSAGKPVRGELAVMVVDEGVLSLLGYATPDPLAFFHHARQPGAPLADLRNALLGKQQGLKKEKRRPSRSGQYGLRGPSNALGNDALGALGTIGVGGLGASGYGRGGGGTGEAMRRERAAPARLIMGSTSPRAPMPDTERKSTGADEESGLTQAPLHIRSRSLFATTAYYNPAVLTDEQGLAEVTVAMPDNLTTYRIMAVALDRGAADRFGNAEAQVKVRKTLLLRPSLPRFLSTGDTFEAAVMVHNETDQVGSVDVLVRGRRVKPDGPTRQQVSIEPHRAKEVRFRLRQDGGGGPARIQFAAVMGQQTDAVEKQLPVLLPVTTEAFATYGMTDGSVTQPVVPPKDALPDHGGLEVSMASTALNGLEDAVSYLVDYPHECTEQTASRVLPIFSLGDILREFHIAKVADLGKQKALATAGVRKLLAFQRYDGGWGMWQGSGISWPYLSAYTTFALLRAKEAGHEVPKHNLDRARAFLKFRLDNPIREFGEQWDYVGQTESAWVLSEMKQYEREHLARLFGLRKKWLPMYSQALLMVALFRAEGKSPRVREILRDLNNAAVQTVAAAHFAETKSESLRLLMHSDDFTDAVVLQALLEVEPEHVLMPKVARGLLDSRVRGRWSTTHANAFALVALARYYKQVEGVPPEFVSQLWYGEGFLGEGKFKGREMKVVQQEVPMAALRKLGAQQLVLAKQGPGKLYYRIGLRYAPTDLKLPPEEQGFSVSRFYEPIADPRTGKVQKGTVLRREDGSWEIKAGSTVRVRVVVVVPDRRYFVAVADPLPAGLEGVNLTFATSARSSLSGQLDNRTYDSWHSWFGWYSLFAFDHREMRDDRVVLFADRLPAGVYEYTYLARATTIGRFVVAPVKAEEMYHPETFGRSATTFVEVK
jgi:alpha-2-macroglobulin